MRCLIACEYSGIVRDAFAALGHDAWSCDLLPTERPGQHYQGDVRDILGCGWDLMIAHPPCTDLAVSCSSTWAEKQADGRQRAAIEFFMMFARVKCERVAIENPVGIMSTVWRTPDQTFHPYHFGHTEMKWTCLWLKNLPKLKPTRNVYNEMMLLPERERQRLRWLPPSPDRGKLRSQTYEGIANAMAQQWGTDAGLVSDMPLFARTQPVGEGD